MLTWLKSLFFRPVPTGPQQRLRAFALDEGTLSSGCVRVENDGWRIDASGNQTVRLFDLPFPEAEQCLMTYRAEIKSEGLNGRAFLEMWCRLPGRGEFFSRGFQQAVSGTTDWAVYEIPFYLRKNQRPDLIKLNLAVEGTGTLWLRAVEILKTPLSA